MTNTPRWFYYVIALCAVVLTATVSYAALADSWVPAGDGAFLNQRTGIACAKTACFNVHTGELTKR